MRALRNVLEVDALSDVYESDPVGFTRQPRFWNMALRAHTSLTPHELLDAAQRIERELGRTPAVRMGPRTMDIDLLLYDELCMDTPDLQIPHPRLHERQFVLRPLADLDDALLLPHVGRSVAQQLVRCGGGVPEHVGSADAVLGVC